MDASQGITSLPASRAVTRKRCRFRVNLAVASKSTSASRQTGTMDSTSAAAWINGLPIIFGPENRDSLIQPFRRDRSSRAIGLCVLANLLRSLVESRFSGLIAH